MTGLIQPVTFKVFKDIVTAERRQGGRVHYAMFDDFCILSIATGSGNFVYECIASKNKVSEIDLKGIIAGGIPTVGRIVNVPDRMGTTLEEIRLLLERQSIARDFEYGKLAFDPTEEDY
jgi:hypothetical protein